MKKQDTFDTGRTAILWSGLILVLILLDQVAKHEALLHLKYHSSISLIPGVLELAYVENRGMAFGMLEGRQFLFVGMCVIFCIALIWIFVRIPKNRYYLPLLLTGAVLFGGAAGNFIDRLFRGYVVDFIYFSLIDFPVFNIADIYVVCGGIVLVFLVVFKYKDEDFEFLSLKIKDK